ncbi:WxL domain-containing protein [Furfurilactobacillus entadae]|uniref:WxL domain-containing protein n=1 Tax=Furfurilactobacillus entadae TaxID=2922307 RepID=UPI0035EEA065
MKYKRHLPWLTGLLTTMFIFLSVSIPVNAADYPNTNPPSAAPVSGFFSQWTGGFQQQPVDTNSVADAAYTLKLSTVRATFFLTADQGDPTVTWNWSENNSAWKPVTNGSGSSGTATVSANNPDSNHQNSSLTNTFKNDGKAHTIYYQAQLHYSGGWFGVGANTYYSNVVKVQISPEIVHATDLSLSVDNPNLPNGHSEVVHPTLTPAQATDKITWSIANPDGSATNVATISDTGLVTASSETSKYGPVVVTAQVSGLTRTLKMFIGGLQDTKALENGKTNPSFEVNGYTKGTTVSAWHHKLANGTDEVIKDGQTLADGTKVSVSTDAATGISNGVLTLDKTSIKEDKSTYYAELMVPVPGTSAQKDQTNTATLSVTPNSLTLDGVPDFSFGSTNRSVPINDIVQGTTLTTTTPFTGPKTTYDGNGKGALQVTDPRGSGAGWTLYASMTPFNNATDKSALGANGGITLNLLSSNGAINNVAVRNDGSQTLVLQQQATSTATSSLDLSPSTLKIAPTPLVSPGLYQSTITWTLANVPNAS